MVLRCYSHTCIWRVYDVLLKNIKLYEVRCVELLHTSSVDDRSGYQTQAMHTVIGEMRKARHHTPKKTFHVVEANAVDNLSSQMSELNLDVNPPASRRPPGRNRKNCQRVNFSTIYVVVAKEVGTTKLLSKWLYEVRNLTTYRSVVSSDAERYITRDGCESLKEHIVMRKARMPVGWFLTLIAKWRSIFENIWDPLKQITNSSYTLQTEKLLQTPMKFIQHHTRSLSFLHYVLRRDS
ncbi:hypothetical protein YC2023_082016 [Brassica napus]